MQKLTLIVQFYITNVIFIMQKTTPPLDTTGGLLSPKPLVWGPKIL